MDERTFLSDAELLIRLQQGDAEAFGVLYERYLDDVYRFFYYRTFHRAEAEDLTETTFLKAWSGLKRMEPRANLNLRPWLLRIARNLWIDRHRTAREEAALDEQAPLAAPLPDPEEAALHEETRSLLDEALQDLPERLREVVVYRFLHGMSHREVAELLGLEEGHVRVLQHRALQRLRRWLESRSRFSAHGGEK